MKYEHAISHDLYVIIKENAFFQKSRIAILYAHTYILVGTCQPWCTLFLRLATSNANSFLCIFLLSHKNKKSVEKILQQGKIMLRCQTSVSSIRVAYTVLYLWLSHIPFYFYQILKRKFVKTMLPLIFVVRVRREMFFKEFKGSNQ